MRGDFETHPVGTGERLKALEALLDLTRETGSAASAVKVSPTAVFRPMRRDVAVMFRRGGEVSSECLSVEEARTLHASLAEAIRLSAHVDVPVGAVK